MLILILTQKKQMFQKKMIQCSQLKMKKLENEKPKKLINHRYQLINKNNKFQNVKYHNFLN
jgi:hypothetical protein